MSVYTKMLNVNIIIRQVKIGLVLAIITVGGFIFIRHLIFVINPVNIEKICNHNFLLAFNRLFLQC